MDLPNQGSLIVPLQWSGSVAKTTLQTGSFAVSGTVGFRPWKETATLTWKLTKADALALLTTLKSGMFNAVYDYECNLRGAVKLRPTDSYSFQERRGTQMVDFTMTFETL